MRLTIVLAIAATALAATSAFSQAATQRLATKESTVAAIPGVVVAGAKWQMFWSGPDNVDGLVGTQDGGVIFAQREVNRIRKVNQDGTASVLMEDTHGAGALGIDYQGRVVAMLRDKPSVWLMTPERKLLTDTYNGTPLKGASDVVVEKRGGLYFDESRRMPTPGVYYLRPDSTMFSFGDGIQANGIALSPDERTLYVTNRDTLVSIDLLPDGTGTVRHDLAKFQGDGAFGDGSAVDTEGRIYVSTRAGVQVVNPRGGLLGVIPTPVPITTLAFSGRDKKELFVAGQGLDANGSNAKTIYKLPMIAQGILTRAK